jgi:hypothetical protein
MAYYPIHFGQFVDGGGICMDVYGGNKQSGAQVISFPCHNGPNQKFRWNKKYGTLQAQHSRKCIYYNPNSLRLEQNKCSHSRTNRRIPIKKRTTYKKKTLKRRR